MNLDELGVYAIGYAYRGQPEQQFALGWSGFFEDRTGVACVPFGTQNGRRAFLLHSPWRNGTGITFQQFAFSLPASASRIILRGYTAMRTANVTNSDGVTFRLYANGIKLFDYHQTNDTWRAFAYDFTTLRGSNLTVRYEVDPGPNNNPSFDYSFWGDRDLILEGYNPPPVVHPVPQTLPLSNVWSRMNGELAPLGGFAGVTNVFLSNDVVHFRYAGPDGTLDYQWSRPTAANAGLFGQLTLNAQMNGDAPVSIPLAGSAAISWAQTATPGSSWWVQTNLGYTLGRSYTVAGTPTTVQITGRLLGKSLVFMVSCDQSNITALDIGSWGPVVRRRNVVAPFYSGSVYLLEQENVFVNAFLDWTSSAATSHSGSKAYYNALTGGTRIPLRERVVFSAGWHLAEVLPNIPNPPSPWLEYLADKIVFDIWGGSFTNIARNLTNLAGYGITNAVALIHDWQRSGYDNALPAHYPAQAGLGGDVGMSNLVQTGLGLGVRCALHENYVDYYPNYEFYDTNDIALDSAGNLQLAWYNPGTKIQSFAVKPNAIMRLAAGQSPEIHRRYGTAANYLDVHSAVPPWFHVDMRFGENGAGQFDRVWDVHRELWAYEREIHRGPVFGEGNNHWYWSGLLDGVEAQFGSGWPGNGGFDAPLAVDFDLLKIHPLQFNHGMGYFSRWWPSEQYATNWAGAAPMIVLDRYRMQEVAFGHAGFLDGSVYANIPLAWLEHHLLSPVMARYATAKPVQILYENGGAWLDASAVARLDNGGTNGRVRIRYENGLVITANGDTNNLVSGAWTLPQFGWIAEGAGITAGTILRENAITDFSDAGNTVFANARPSSDWNLSSFRRVRPSVASFAQTTTRSFQVTYRWDVQERLGKDYTCFVHFCSNTTIRFQQDHAVTPRPSQWAPGQVVADGLWTVSLPSAIPDGDYDWVIGLYDSLTGGRLRLQGMDAGESRIRLGTLHVANAGALITFTAETNISAFDPSGWYAQHLNGNGQVIDFGDLRTDGSVWLACADNVWTLKTWPRSRNFTLELSRRRFGEPAKVQSPGGTNAEVVPVLLGTRWRLPLNGAGEYRWTNSGLRTSILIPTGAVWKYLDTGQNMGTAWTQPSFDDSGWPMGPAMLGYGDANGLFPRTTNSFGTNANNKFVTTYYRATFLASNTASATGLEGRLVRDDGAVVYLNGTEIFRNNMPPDPVNYLTLATNNVTGADESTWHPFAASASFLRVGTNVVAVEIHQNSAGSSDLAFDLEFASTGNEPPQIGLTAPPDGLMAAADRLVIAAAASDPENAITRVDFFGDGLLIGQDTQCPWEMVWSNVPPGEHVLRARVVDSGGRSAVSSPVRLNLASPAATLVQPGSVWRYHDGGLDLSNAWSTLESDDNSWAVGPAQLGYGDYDEATVVSYGPDPGNKFVTTYFRHQFLAFEPTNYATLLLRLLRDDGAIVYLNGQEVYRSNMPLGPPNYRTLAASIVSGGDETNWISATLAPSFLQAGTNLLAVEIHQCASSTDISFDLELKAFLAGSFPRMHATAGSNEVILAWPGWAAGYTLAMATNLAPPVRWFPLGEPLPLLSNDWNLIVLVMSNELRFFRLESR